MEVGFRRSILAPVTQIFEDCYTDCYAAGGQLGENKACCGAFFCYSPPLLCYATIALGPHFWYFLKVCYTKLLKLSHMLPHIRAIEQPWYQGLTPLHTCKLYTDILPFPYPQPMMYSQVGCVLEPGPFSPTVNTFGSITLKSWGSRDPKCKCWPAAPTLELFHTQFIHIFYQSIYHLDWFLFCLFPCYAIYLDLLRNLLRNKDFKHILHR